MKLNKLLKAFALWLLVAVAAVQTSSAQVSARKILPNDVLLIRVLNEPDMMAEKKVTADGKIDYYFIGEVDVNDKTLAETQKIIRDKLDADYLVDPQVYVEVKQYALQYVTVTGQVNRPGQVQLPPDHQMDIVEAIGAAGDFNRFANKNRIELRRKQKTTRYSYDDLKKPDGRVYVEPEDVIEVAESKL
jgi:polysaccharide export outer membrane protein